jgi:hypothetical protein
MAEGSRAACGRFEDVAKDIAFPKPMQSVLRKSRAMRNLVVKIEPTKPAICQMQFDFLRQSSLRAQPIAVANYQHSDHQFGINQWPTDLAIVRLKPLVNISERRRYKPIDALEQMIFGTRSSSRN